MLIGLAAGLLIYVDDFQDFHNRVAVAERAFRHCLIAEARRHYTEEDTPALEQAMLNSCHAESAAWMAAMSYGMDARGVAASRQAIEPMMGSIAELCLAAVKEAAKEGKLDEIPDN